MSRPRNPPWPKPDQFKPVTMLPKYLGGADKAGAQRTMQAMLGMVKLDIDRLKRAYERKSAA